MRTVCISNSDSSCTFSETVNWDGEGFVLDVKGQSEHGDIDMGFLWRDEMGENGDNLWDLSSFFRKHTKYSFFSLLERSNKEVVLAEEGEESGEEVYAGMSSCCFESCLKKENGNLVYEVEMTSVGSYGVAKFEFGVMDEEKLKEIKKIVYRFEENLLDLAFTVKKHYIDSMEFEDIEE